MSLGQQPGTKPGTKPGTAATRERILDASEALFAQRGFAGVAMRDIAREIDLTAASLYNHFAGKQALYEAVLERGVRPLLELMEGLSARALTPASQDALIESIMAHLGRRPHLPRLIHHEVISGGAYLARLARAWIRPILEQGILEMKRGEEAYWDEEEYPLMMTAWLNLVFGHFAMAPLLGVVFETDPLAPEVLARQTRFLQKLARAMRAGPAGGSPSIPAARHPAGPSREDAT